MKHRIGDVIQGKITNIKDYGVFVQFDEGYSGLIHISKINGSYIKNIEDFLYVGEKIYAKIVSIDEENKRFELTLIDLNYLNGKLRKPGIMESLGGFDRLKKEILKWIKK